MQLPVFLKMYIVLMEQFENSLNLFLEQKTCSKDIIIDFCRAQLR